MGRNAVTTGLTASLLFAFLTATAPAAIVYTPVRSQYGTGAGAFYYGGSDAAVFAVADAAAAAPRRGCRRRRVGGRRSRSGGTCCRGCTRIACRSPTRCCTDTRPWTRRTRRRGMCRGTSARRTCWPRGRGAGRELRGAGAGGAGDGDDRDQAFGRRGAAAAPGADHPEAAARAAGHGGEAGRGGAVRGRVGGAKEGKTNVSACGQIVWSVQGDIGLHGATAMCKRSNALDDVRSGGVGSRLSSCSLSSGSSRC